MLKQPNLNIRLYFEKYYKIATIISKDFGCKLSDITKIISAIKIWLNNPKINRNFTKEMNVLLQIEQKCLREVFGTA